MVLENMLRKENEKAMEKGSLQTLCHLVKKGLLTIDAAIEEAPIPKEDFLKLLEESK